MGWWILEPLRRPWRECVGRRRLLECRGLPWGERVRWWWVLEWHWCLRRPCVGRRRLLECNRCRRRPRLGWRGLLERHGGLWGPRVGRRRVLDRHQQLRHDGLSLHRLWHDSLWLVLRWISLLGGSLLRRVPSPHHGELLWQQLLQLGRLVHSRRRSRGCRSRYGRRCGGGFGQYQRRHFKCLLCG